MVMKFVGLNTGWTFFTHICCKIVIFVLKDENIQKEAGNGPFLRKKVKF